MICLWQVTLFHSILPTADLWKLESMLSNAATALPTKLMQYSKSFVVMSTICTFSLGMIPSEGTSCFAYPQEASLHPLKFYAEIAAIQSYLQSLLLIEFSYYFHYIWSYSLHWNFNSPKTFMKVWIQFFSNPVNVSIFTSSKCIMNVLNDIQNNESILEAFNFLCPDASKESLTTTAIDLQNIFLK